LLESVPARAVAADKAYDAQSLIDAIAASGAEVVIPPRANRSKPRTVDWQIYKRRNLVSASSVRSSTFAESPRATTSSTGATKHSSLSQRRGSGSRNVTA
jgi:transposase